MKRFRLVERSLGRMRSSHILYVVAATVLVFASACGGSDGEQTTTTPAPKPKLQVVVTTPVLKDFVEVIGSDHVEVYGILKPNVDAHDYETTPSDITAIARADVIFKNGVGLEDWFDKTMETAEKRGPIVDVSRGVTIRGAGDPSHPQGDPHIWHSPLNARIMVKNVRDALITADAANKDNYETNFRAYTAQIDALKQEVGQALDAVVSRKIVTSHNSIGYYIDEFHLEFVGSVIPSLDSEAEPSSQELTALVNRIKTEDVKAVFAETSVPAKSAATVANEANVKLVAGADALYGDSLGSKGSDADTYLKMERHNTNVIVENLR